MALPTWLSYSLSSDSKQTEREVEIKSIQVCTNFLQRGSPVEEEAVISARR